MLHQKQHNLGLVMVELNDGIKVYTSVTHDCIPALRSGFAGYPVNPRWNALKYHAWKVGRQWRQAMDHGKMVVKSGFLVLVDEAISADDSAEFEPNPSEPRLCNSQSQVPTNLQFA